jgi:hypothetical protein
MQISIVDLHLRLEARFIRSLARDPSTLAKNRALLDRAQRLLDAELARVIAGGEASESRCEAEAAAPMSR